MGASNATNYPPDFVFISECPHCSLALYSFQAVSPGVRDVLLNPMDRKCFDDMDASSFWLGNLWCHIVVYV